MSAIATSALADIGATLLHQRNAIVSVVIKVGTLIEAAEHMVKWLDRDTAFLRDNAERRGEIGEKLFHEEVLAELRAAVRINNGECL